ncbi:MAG: protein-tyrosine-phosphatase [Acidobacteria bacterium]|nr:MAG: protein-tyrosine-phosphatase [Acidobacteriota bacterium]
MSAVATLLFPEIEAYLAEVRTETDLISPERRTTLDQLALFIDERRSRGEIARLVFICTHNSRRSHLAQIWAQTVAHAFGLNGIETYSGGTEATAFNARAVAAVERAGFRVETVNSAGIPLFTVRIAPEVQPMECFSKVYDQAPNPDKDFCAVMTCSAADEHCPIVFGAAERLVVPYDDPKEFDTTPDEERQYDERCRQIAREMVWALGRVRS